jgi:hypothetical protein
LIPIAFPAQRHRGTGAAGGIGRIGARLYLLGVGEAVEVRVRTSRVANPAIPRGNLRGIAAAGALSVLFAISGFAPVYYASSSRRPPCPRFPSPGAKAGAEESGVKK